MKNDVEYYCSCDWEESHSIYRLYFCPYCYELRCSYCLQEEIVCYYCPNCLFEVPSALAKTGKNRCNRNCYSCPICMGSLTLINKTHHDTLKENEENNSSYDLACSNCGWMSNEDFEKPSSVYAYYLKQEEESPIRKEFLSLYTYYEHLNKSKQSTQIIPYKTEQISWYEREKSIKEGL
jgi:dynactin-4